MADQSTADQQQANTSAVSQQEDQKSSSTDKVTLEALRAKLNDPGTDFAQRDAEGRGLLHQAVLAGADPQLLGELSARVDLSLRDALGRTALDLVQDGDSAAAGLREALEGKLMELMKSGGEQWEREGERLILAGYSVQLPLSTQQAQEKSEEASRIQERLLELQTKVNKVHRAVEGGQKDDLQTLTTGQEDAAKLLTAADCTGLRPLHKAVLFRQGETLKYLVGALAGDNLNVLDHMGRTALHLAAALAKDDVEMFKTLKDAGADDAFKDLAGRTAADYLESPELLPVADILKRVQQAAASTTTNTASTSENSAQDASNTAEGKAAESTQQEQSVEAVQTERQSPPLPQNGPDRTPSPPKEPSKPAEVKPVSMYVCGQEKSGRAPPPTTVDGKYVAQHLGTALTLALAEIAEKRPWDPVEYLGQWLHKYRKTMDDLEKQKQLLNDIREEERAANEEEITKFKRREEQLRIEEEERKRKEEEEAARKKQEQEELQRQAKEALLAQKPNLPTVSEEEAEDSGVRERDDQGQTELHVLAAQSGADLVAVLNLGHNLADRDARNRTARDVAEELGLTENVDTIDQYVSNLLEQEKLDTLRQLLVDGYDKLPDALSKVSTDGLPSTVTDFVNSIPQLQERVNAVLTAVRGGVSREVENVLERKGLALARDHSGRCPLHVALLAGHQDIARTLVDTNPLCLKARDNLNRTPLHYAMALSEEMADFLREKGADPNAKDAKQRTPDYYKDQKEEILELQAALAPDTQQQQQDSPGEDASQSKADGEGTAAVADDNSGSQPTAEAEKADAEPVSMATTLAPEAQE